MTNKAKKSATTLQEIAGEARDWFEQRTRVQPVGTTFWTCKNSRPVWIMELCHAAHDKMLPDDWKYQFIVDSLDVLSELEAGNDPEDDINERLPQEHEYAELVSWLGSSTERWGYVEEAVAHIGLPPPTDFHLDNLITDGFWREQEEVYLSVLGSLRKQLEEEGTTNA